MLSPDVYLETMRERERTNKRYGVLLIENGVLSPAEVYRAIRKQIEAIVWSLFYWQEGSVIFSIGEFREPDAVRIQLPMRQVILQGIKRAPDAKALVARLGRKETVLETCYKTEQLIELALDADEYKLLSLVDGRRTPLRHLRPGAPQRGGERQGAVRFPDPPADAGRRGGAGDRARPRRAAGRRLPRRGRKPRAGPGRSRSASRREGTSSASDPAAIPIAPKERHRVMPIYEYECLKCGKRTELLQRMGDAPLAACRAGVRRRGEEADLGARRPVQG